MNFIVIKINKMSEDNPERTNVPSKEKVTLYVGGFSDYDEEIEEEIVPAAKLFNKIQTITEPVVIKVLPPPTTQAEVEEAKIGGEEQEQQDGVA